MDRQQHHVGGGVKVTYIETQFVTSDAAGFKDLVQRLTGRSPTATAAGVAQAPVAAPHYRPRACAAGEGTGIRTTSSAAAVPQGGDDYRRSAGCPAVATSRAPPCLQDELLMLGKMENDDFSKLFYVGASDPWRHAGSFNGGYYNNFPYC
ncbi:unnamed protein product [Urochloa humidicola]